MISVLLVDDEPATLNYVGGIIKKYCLDYKVVGYCGDGYEALKKIRELSPNLVITDIKMPKMNGIELLRHMKANYSDIKTIIMSGYRDFEYAKTGLEMGALSYILKPVNPKKVCVLMDETSTVIGKHLYRNRLEILHELKKGRDVKEWRVKYYFPVEDCYFAILRRNGLRGRFIETPINGQLAIPKNIITLNMHDKREVLFLSPAYETGFNNFKAQLLKLSATEMEGFITVLMYSTPTTVAKIATMLPEIYRRLNEDTIFGQNFFILAEKANADSIEQPVFNHNILKWIEYHALYAEPKEAKNVILQQIEKWRKEKPTQLWLKTMVNRMIVSMCKYCLPDFSWDRCQYMLEDAFYSSKSYEMLYKNLEPLFKYVTQNLQPATCKADSKEFFSNIVRYIHEHLSEPLCLNSLCSTFKLSQTYISRLFRKYTGQSFVKYLLDVRIKNAKVLMTENPDMYVKDIAHLCGFNDQFYFSKVFKKVTGYSPSEYIVKKQ